MLNVRSVKNLILSNSPFTNFKGASINDHKNRADLCLKVAVCEENLKAKWFVKITNTV